MAIEDSRTFEIRGKKVEVHAERTGERMFMFHGVCEGFVRRVNVAIGSEEGSTVKSREELQESIDKARSTAAELAVRAAEHDEFEAGID